MTNPTWSDYATGDSAEYAELWNGCVGAWCPSLGPSGSLIHDLSAFNRRGTLTGTTLASAWVLSQGKYAIDLDGTDDHINFGTTAGNFLKTDTFTAAGWFYAESAWAAFYQLFGKQGAAPALTGWRLSNSTAGNREKLRFLLVADSASTDIITLDTTSNVISAAGWYHIAVTYSGTSTAAGVSVYVNGVSRALTTVNDTLSGTTTNTEPFAVGIRVADSAGPYNGLVDDIRLYNTVLNQRQIATLALRRGIAYEPFKRRLAASIEVAASSFQSAWASRSNVLIGATGY